MKALPMLDHVMLWYVRLFTAFLLIVGFIMPVILLHSIFGWISLPGAIFLLWAVCSWSLNRDIARLYLGLSAGVGIGIIAYLFFAAGDYMTSDGNIEVRGCLILAGMLASLTPLIWVSIRPPRTASGPTLSKAPRAAAPLRKRFPFFMMLLRTPLPSFR
jgi:hypothetical protein